MKNILFQTYQSPWTPLQCQWSCLNQCRSASQGGKQLSSTAGWTTSVIWRQIMFKLNPDCCFIWSSSCCRRPSHCLEKRVLCTCYWTHRTCCWSKNQCQQATWCQYSCNQGNNWTWCWRVCLSGNKKCFLFKIFLNFLLNSNSSRSFLIKNLILKIICF